MVLRRIALPVLLVAAACGSGRLSDTAYAATGGELVFMRALVPATGVWETISVRSNGAAHVRVLIGERTPIQNRYFRLGTTQLRNMRRLIAQATQPRRLSAGDPSEIYTVRTRGRTTTFEKGQSPQRDRLIVALYSLIEAHA